MVFKVIGDISWRDDVFKYTLGIIKNKGHKPIIIDRLTEQVHAFVG
jgi:hypothetical protein